MTPEAPAPTRRALRGSSTGSVTTTDAAPRVEGSNTLADAPLPVAAPTRTAFAWVDPQTLGTRHPNPGDEDAAPVRAAPPDLLANAPRRSPFRPGVLVPLGVMAVLAGGYAATTLLWPLHAAAPQVVATEVLPVAAPAAAPAWPGAGSAAIAVDGIGIPLASSPDARTIASITKVVTALVVLDEMPLAPGEQGPEYRFTYGDRSDYWDYRDNGESALDVPVDGALSEYQLLEGMLIGSANNYADRLASNLWPSDQVYARAAEEWLAAHGVSGITVVDPSGIEYGNIASAEALIPLAERALAEPVIAEIVAKQAIDLPGAGLVENTNSLLADPGMLGIKTGSLDAFNLLSAKQVQIGDTSVRLYASVLGQPDDESRDAVSRALFAQLEAELQLRPSVSANAVIGTVETEWGQSVEIVTDADADVVLWNGAVATVDTRFDLGDASRDGEALEAGDTVGSLTVTGPLDATEVPAHLAADIDPPSAWWRLTHPLALFGLD